MAVGALLLPTAVLCGKSRCLLPSDLKQSSRNLERLARLQSARDHGDAAVCCTAVEAGVPQSSV